VWIPKQLRHPPPKAKGTAYLYELMARSEQYDDLIAMGRGDPDLDTPPHIVAAAQAAIEAGENTPSPLAGLPDLREAIARRVQRVNGIAVDPETEVVVTNGGQEAVFLMAQTLVGAGDEIIVPIPGYNSYKNAVEFAGARYVEVQTYVHEDFEVDPDRVRGAITSQTRSLILNSPNNPSAGVIPPANVEALVEIAASHNLTILSDDIYDSFVYDGAEHLSPASLPEGRERTLTLNAVSKMYSMTGWRVGWVVGPAHLTRRVAELKVGVSGPTSVIAQRAAIAALDGPQECVAEAKEIYTRRRRLVMDALDEMGLTYGVPKGGQFVFVDISSTGLDCWTVVQRVLDEAHVLIYPGAAFGAAWENYVRITFLQPEPLIEEALARMKQVL
jgi:aminotransferase